jgi:hypothetical protein
MFAGLTRATIPPVARSCVDVDAMGYQGLVELVAHGAAGADPR